MSRRHRAPESVFDDGHLAGRAHPVIAALHAPATDEELRGYNDVLATYRATMATRRTRGLLVRAFGTSAAGVAAAVLLTGGVAAAAYGAHLPDPVQRVAHRLLGPFGVPEPAHHRAPRHHVVRLVPAPANASAPPHIRRRHAVPAHPARIELTTAVKVVSARGSMTVRGTLHTRWQRRSDQLAVLLAHRADDRTWRRVATARTGTSGSVVFAVHRLLVDTEFRLRIGTLSSNLVRVDVRPVLSAAVRCTATRDRCTISITATGGQAGDLVLLRRVTGASTAALSSVRLDRRGHAQFVVDTDPTNPQTYRLTVRATRLHTDGSTHELRLPESRNG